MDDDVRKLADDDRLVEAAELSASRGDLSAAIDLLERACAFDRASVFAEEHGDLTRATRLALDARDEERAKALIDRAVADPAHRDRVLHELGRRNAHVHLGRALEKTGALRDAASAYERAGAFLESAEAWERAGDPARASAVLETAMRNDPTDARANVAQGRLLLRHGKTEAALRALQRVGPSSPWRREALGGILRAATAMGLDGALEDARRELAASGGPLPDDAFEGAETVDATGVAAAGTERLLFGRYAFLREIASSATARVVQCTDRVRGDLVAVKLFVGANTRGGGRDAFARFEREVRVLGGLEHPNLVAMRDYESEGPALVMPWMDGGTLETKLAEGHLTPRRSVEIASAILAALGEAHRVGVLHRDVKPANVLFDGAGVAKLADFGVAHLGEVDATATALVVGSLAYMSPEQRNGEPATLASDLYGVGAVLAEMLTGVRPAFRSDGSGHLEAMPSAVHADLDARHDALVLSLLAELPEDRPEDAFAARRALASLPWTDRVELTATLATESHPASERPAAGRFLPVPGERNPAVHTDTWFDRAVEFVPWSEAVATRARAWIQVGHRTFETLLAVDRTGPDGARLVLGAESWVPARPLSSREVGDLAEGLALLHDAGHVHGAVDDRHVVRGRDGDVVLRFAPELAAGASAVEDRHALALFDGPGRDR
ncbi:MAG: protein kinase [Polyangiaceae bacterium]